jgi:predicted dithiol-disulfide oxidoreductase (DUF899 family)
MRMTAHLSFPNESAEYRQARQALLEAEIALRARIEAVAVQRRNLPPGGEVPQDYEFERIGADLMPERVKMSELFGPHDTLILYSFMYGPDRQLPCPGCTHLLDSINGGAQHVARRASLYIVAKSPLARLTALASDRGWDHLKFVSTAGNDYDADYFGDTSKLSPEMRKEFGVPDGENWDETMFNVFRLDEGQMRHFWGSELSFAKAEPNQNHRSGDAVNALWGMLDMTPEGRGKFFPKVVYD